PSPTNFGRLATACSSLSNVKLLQCGLGRENSTMQFQQGADELGATSRIVAAASGIDIEVRSAASLIAAQTVRRPNAVKIDVEGFELDVLEGFGGHLGSPDLRTVGIEVHFGILNERGMSDAPRQIEALL